MVVELLPEEQWKAPARSLPTGAAASPEAAAEDDDGAEGGHIAQVHSGAQIPETLKPEP